MTTAAREPGPDPASESVTESRTTQTAEFSQALAAPPLHAGDRVPDWLLDIQSRLYSWLSADTRVVLGFIIAATGVLAVALLASLRVLEVVFDYLDVFAFIGLFVVNWLGNGGALVPIPGARLLGLLMIFSNTVLLPSWEVLLVGGAAMGLGLLSYYLVGARADRAVERGDVAHGVELATEAGLFGDDSDPGRLAALRRRFNANWSRLQARAEPVIARHGTWGMYWLCLAPLGLGSAAAFLGGALGFGFVRFVGSAFTAKFTLAAVVVGAGLIFDGAARAVQLPF